MKDIKRSVQMNFRMTEETRAKFDKLYIMDMQWRYEQGLFGRRPYDEIFQLAVDALEREFLQRMSDEQPSDGEIG